ncbi:MAG: phosphoribosyl-AMP cyclohydrolase [Coriobacteriia bacterium]|nr:phosphoribosyl-AMP cyclohydrolase [Coriobacteriia bacterium]
MEPLDFEKKNLSTTDMRFDPDGLLPAIVQDENTGEVLMLAYMDEEALIRTLDERRAWFYSRSRGAQWMKGEQSGNIMQVVSAWYDCDADTVLLKVIPLGAGVACHTGAKSCFYRRFDIKES